MEAAVRGAKDYLHDLRDFFEELNSYRQTETKPYGRASYSNLFEQQERMINK